MKILFVGYSCAGKSYFARRIAWALNLVCLDIDYLFYDYSQPDLPARDCAAVKAETHKFLELHDSWIMDGGYDRTGLYECCDAADRIVLMKVNRFERLINLYRRCRTDNFSETMHCFFHSFMWIVKKGCGKKYIEKSFSSIFSFPEKVTVIRSRHAARKFADSIIQSCQIND